MKLPSVRSLALALTPIRTIAKTDNTCIDVRLQVDDDGEWRIHIGEGSYDEDHEGWWGYELLDCDSDVVIAAQNMIDEICDHLYIHGAIN